MPVKKRYREGGIGALMDEYERAVHELQRLLATIDSDLYVRILDTKTKDKDCQSIQTIMNHVVRAGFGYCNYIRKQFGDDFIERKTKVSFNGSFFLSFHLLS